MEIVETQVYRGANYWAPMPAIRFLLDIGELEERPTDRIPGFYEQLTTTLPGMIELTRTLSYRWSSINASVNPFNPNFDALYPAPPKNAFLPARLEMLTMKPPARALKRASASCAQ